MAESESSLILGTWLGSCVVVDDEDTAVRIFELGYFGKGTLSRGIPEVAIHHTRGTQDAAMPMTEAASAGSMVLSNRDAMFARAQRKRQRIMALAQSGVREGLQLSLLEAFYLAYELKMLRISHENGKSITVEDCWMAFAAHNDTFCAHFLAYRYLRTQGWVPRSGLRYGAAFVVYRAGPEQEHAEYAVLVQHETSNPVEMSWRSLLCNLRVTRQVLKGVMVLSVRKQDGYDDRQISTADEYLSAFTITETRLQQLAE